MVPVNWLVSTKQKRWDVKMVRTSFRGHFHLDDTTYANSDNPIVSVLIPMGWYRSADSQLQIKPMMKTTDDEMRNWQSTRRQHCRFELYYLPKTSPVNCVNKPISVGIVPVNSFLPTNRRNHNRTKDFEILNQHRARNTQKRHHRF